MLIKKPCDSFFYKEFSYATNLFEFEYYES